MDENDSLGLLARWKDGDERAATLLFERYVNQLITMARKMLSEPMQRRVAAEDVVQSAYRSFFCKAGDDRYVLEKSGDLWKLLATITVSTRASPGSHCRFRSSHRPRHRYRSASRPGHSPRCWSSMTIQPFVTLLRTC